MKVELEKEKDSSNVGMGWRSQASLIEREG